MRAVVPQAHAGCDLKVSKTALEGVLVIEPQVYGDERGYFIESYQRERYAAHGIDSVFVQDNHSFSTQRTLRGLHAQYRKPQGKLVRVLEGEIYDVVVDLRPDSDTFGAWFGEILSGGNFKQVYIPPGYAHGFCVVSPTAHFLYKCTDYYDPDGEMTVQWNDPAIGIDWPVTEPLVSAKDAHGMSLAEAKDFLLAL